MNAPARSWRRWFSPHGHINQVDLEQLRDRLIAVMQRWGMPQRIKVDNGQPFGDPQQKSIPVLALWLMSLKIRVIWNRPRHPQDNAKVERMQGTSHRWVDLDRCADRGVLQRGLDAVALIHREHYAVSHLGFKTRKAAFPALYLIERPYLSAGFEAGRAWRFLSQTQLVRKVGGTGRIRLYGHGYQVGRAYRGQEVAVGFDAQDLLWLVYDEQGHLIKVLEARSMSPSDIWSLSVSQSAESVESLKLNVA